METNTPTPIFYDPHKKRWPRIKNSFWVIVFILFLLLSGFIISIFLTPHLNNLPLAPVNHLRAIKYHWAKEKTSLARHEEISKNLIPKFFLTRTRSDYKPLMIGFLVNYDDASFRSLASNLNHIDVVIGEFLHLNSNQGDFIEDDPTQEKMLKTYIDSHRSQTKIIPLINNVKNNDWQSSLMSGLLSDDRYQEKLINSLLNFVRKSHYTGINIDFENIPKAYRNQFTHFIQNLSRIFHLNGLSVSIDVTNDDTVYDLKKLATFVDYIVLMQYDEHWADSHEGPIASLNWFAKELRSHLYEIPPNKLVIGLGSYGYDWIKNKKNATEKNFQELMLTAKDASADIVLDPASLNPTYQYLENPSIKHGVWFLDSSTLFNQIAISERLHPFGYALWRLGSEDPSFWQLVGNKLNRRLISKLEFIDSGYAVDYQGKGEILRVVQEPQPGFRHLTYDAKRGIITREKYQTFPTSYVINRYGGDNSKKLVLTFDDGPDPVYTPQILDILKATQTPATFFVIGSNALMYPSILKRELVEGHEIGNHTFTHPNIAEISTRQLKVEVTSTERLLESFLGKGSHLFRPPYAEDSEPETPDRVKQIYSLSKMGYLIVGMNIDPSDWMQPGTDMIVQRILEDAKSNKGNIILLHDSGGKRDQTVAALPRMIAELRMAGFQLVSISDLLGVPPSEIMPSTVGKSVWESVIDTTTFDIMYYGSSAIKLLFFLGIILGLLRLILQTILAIYQKVKDKSFDSELFKGSVAVIVPAYNEAKVILQTIDCLLETDHPDKFEIIVVDDGSKDNTLELLQKTYGNNPTVKIISQPNRGKSAALNNAIRQTDADIIVTLDADTLFLSKTICELISPFHDPQIGAVAGNIKVGNKINILTKWQALEYITSQNLERRAFKVLDAITVVPGSVGAWRRDLVTICHGFTEDTLAEDADLTLKIRKLNYQIVFAEKAIALTEAPDSIKTFLKQRYRWMFGTFQVAWKHKEALFKRKYGYLGFISLPSIFIYQVLFPFIAPLMDLLLILALTTATLNRIYHPLEYYPGTLLLILTYYVLFTSIDFATAFIGFLLESKEDKKLLFWLIPQRFFYRQLIYYVAFKTVLASLRGRMVGWDNITRKATVRKQQVND